MKLGPFFSVVIPTFNRAEKLKGTIQSVLDQIFKDFELLIVDDGSTDNTPEVVDSFSDSRIHYEWVPNSGGPATPRNRGIEISQADWICFLDADDIWYSNKLESVFTCIQDNPDIDVFCNNEICRIVSTGKTRLLKYGPYEDDFYQKMLIQGNRVSTSAVTVCKAFLNRHNLRFNQSKDYVALEDYDLWLHIALYGGRFHFIKKTLGEYIVDNDNISLIRESVRHNMDVLLRDHVFEIQSFEPNRERLWRQVQSRIAVVEAKEHLRNGSLKAAVEKMAKALASSPKSAVQYPILRIVQEGRRRFPHVFNPNERA